MANEPDDKTIDHGEPTVRQESSVAAKRMSDRLFNEVKGFLTHDGPQSMAMHMSLRMWLAGQAMNGMMVAGNFGDHLVDMAFKFADDMILRSKK